MSDNNSVARSLHDLGAAAWFGGSLMGAVGLNGAAAAASSPAERLQLSSQGWARWTPVNAAAIGAHLVGGIALLAGNQRRLRHQPGAKSVTVAKVALTLTAGGLTAYSGVLGRTVDKHASQGGATPTEPSSGASAELAKAQKRLKAVQWATPAVTGALVVLGAVQGEQQRPRALLSAQAMRPLRGAVRYGPRAVPWSQAPRAARAVPWSQAPRAARVTTKAGAKAAKRKLRSAA
ncbi:MAG TPA: hypothetical protein VFJ14_16640 [Nocardioidaceae bacterium]|nr:hypothetical protein [Nocardioidaceae bacterium]